MKLFIADDSQVIVKRPADLLEEVPGTQLVGQAGDVPGAVSGIQEMKPDALILDLQMPGGSGPAIVGFTSASLNGSMVIYLSGRSEAGCARASPAPNVFAGLVTADGVGGLSLTYDQNCGGYPAQRQVSPEPTAWPPTGARPSRLERRTWLPTW